MQLVCMYIMDTSVNVKCIIPLVATFTSDAFTYTLLCTMMHHNAPDPVCHSSAAHRHVCLGWLFFSQWTINWQFHNFGEMEPSWRFRRQCIAKFVYTVKCDCTTAWRAIINIRINLFYVFHCRILLLAVHKQCQIRMKSCRLPVLMMMLMKKRFLVQYLCYWCRLSFFVRA